MNSISATYRQSKYTESAHLDILVDDTPLADLIEGADRQMLDGLVPTLLDWMMDPKETDFVWERINPEADTTSICPILMCPDDADLWCTVVLVEIRASADTVRWRQFGLDIGKYNKYPEQVGRHVDWFQGLGPYVFDRSDYEKMLVPFRREVDVTATKDRMNSRLQMTLNDALIPQDVSVLCIYLKTEENGYSIYLTGQSKVNPLAYEAAENNFGLGLQSRQFDKSEMLEFLKETLEMNLKFKYLKLPQHIETLTLTVDLRDSVSMNLKLP